MKKILIKVFVFTGLLIFFLFMGLCYLLSPRDVSKMDSLKVFERYVYSPMSGSVKISSCNGTVALAGKSVRICFSISKNDFQKILDNGYKKVDSVQEDLIPEEAKKKLDKMIYYQKQDRSGIKIWTIITDDNNSIVYFNYFCA